MNWFKYSNFFGAKHSEKLSSLLAWVTREGGFRQHLSVSMRGRGDLGEYIFLNSVDSSSLSKSTAGLRPSCSVENQPRRPSAWPNQSCIFPIRQIDFRKVFYLSFSTNIFQSCSRDFILQNLILRTRSCGTGFITQYSWVFNFRLTTIVRWKYFVPQLYQFRMGISGGTALKYFYMIHWGGRGITKHISAYKFNSEAT